ncbi:MAG TPA: cupin domain-containing protein [Anaeromyxobacteraceae bacterium]|nr:cupin domain-containing protein [Anaeromyxobacteraceae bacterium]
MSRILIQRFSVPDETMPFVDKGRVDVLHVGEAKIGRAVFEPGWRWSRHEQPLFGTRSCEMPHLGYVLSGRLCIRMDDGEQVEVAAGDWVTVPPGHDAWTVGGEPCVILDVAGLSAQASAREGRGGRPSAEQHAH